MLIIYIAAAVVAVVIIWCIVTYNGLIRRQAMVSEAWSGIDAQLKRRADLIPNLVSSVEGYVSHERETLNELTKLRSESTADADVTKRAQSEQAITAAIGKLMAVAEAYPNLKASENFQSLQSELATLEDQIQLARRYYNGTVREYNVTIQQFPSSIIASHSGFETADFFELEDKAERDAPQVSFS